MAKKKNNGGSGAGAGSGANRDGQGNTPPPQQPPTGVGGGGGGGDTPPAPQPPEAGAWSWSAGGRALPLRDPRLTPAIVGQELERIENERGSLTRRAVVDESRPADAPLHRCFTWNDAVAAQNWREEEAGRCIRSVWFRFTPEPPPGTINRSTAMQDVEAPAFLPVRLADPDTGGTRNAYLSTDRVADHPNYRAQQSDACLRAFRSICRRYEWMEELATLIEAVRDACIEHDPYADREDAEDEDGGDAA